MEAQSVWPAIRLAVNAANDNSPKTRGTVDERADGGDTGESTLRVRTVHPSSNPDQNMWLNALNSQANCASLAEEKIRSDLNDRNSGKQKYRR